MVPLVWGEPNYILAYMIMKCVSTHSMSVKQQVGKVVVQLYEATCTKHTCIVVSSTGRCKLHVVYGKVTNQQYR